MDLTGEQDIRDDVWDLARTSADDVWHQYKKLEPVVELKSETNFTKNIRFGDVCSQ